MDGSLLQRKANLVFEGQIPMSKLVYNVGINDVKFGKRDNKVAYQTWQDMLGRCFDKGLKNKNPTYLEVTCCKEWLRFSSFLVGFKGHYKEGGRLDKDLLIYNNKIYSPDTCIFVSPIVNSFCISKGRSKLPLGVIYNRYTYKNTSKGLSKPYRASIRKHGKPTKSLGQYENINEAHRAWQKAKISYGKEIITTEADPKIIKGIYRIIDKIQEDYNNNLETIYF